MEQKQETKRIVRLLESTAKMAEHASLTGALKESNKAAVRQYNSVLKYLEKNNAVPEELFTSLEENASLDEIGLFCKQLAAYLKEDEPEESGKKSKSEAPRIGDIVNIGGDLGEIGKIVRDAMSSAFAQKEKKKEKEPEPEEKKEAAEEEEASVDLDEVESQISELGSQLQVMAERIRRESLSQQEMKELADKMNRVGTKYAELAKQRAKIRLHLENSVNTG